MAAIYVVNAKKLIGKIFEEGFNIKSFSKEISMSRNTLTRHLKSAQGFKLEYYCRITTALKLTEIEKHLIFTEQSAYDVVVHAINNYRNAKEDLPVEENILTSTGDWEQDKALLKRTYGTRRIPARTVANMINMKVDNVYWLAKNNILGVRVRHTYYFLLPQLVAYVESSRMKMQESIKQQDEDAEWNSQ